MLKHILFSQNTEQPIEWFDEYDRQAIRKSIVAYLTANPTDCIEHCKEYCKGDLKRYSGYNILNFYEVNPKNGKPSLVIQRCNNKKTYITLTID